MGHRLQAWEIEPKLRELSGVASSVEPGLASRLEEIHRWIKDIKAGSLMQKKFLMGFLLELIQDAEVCLDLHVLTADERQLFFSQLTPTVRYWYECLFPKWFNGYDRKFYIWKKKLKSGEFKQEDAIVIESLGRQLKMRAGTVVHRYVADLSMATDAIAGGETGKPLCVQLTSMSDAHSQKKYNEWESTLRGWDIDRGLFVSYKPGKDEFMIEVVNVILHNSKHLPVEKYLKFSF